MENKETTKGTKTMRTEMTAREMALTSHNLSANAHYARTNMDTLWVWSAFRELWVLVPELVSNPS